MNLFFNKTQTAQKPSYLSMNIFKYGKSFYNSHYINKK